MNCKQLVFSHQPTALSLQSFSGYIDMPPFPPGITCDEAQRNHASSGRIEAAAMGDSATMRVLSGCCPFRYGVHNRTLFMRLSADNTTACRRSPHFHDSRVEYRLPSAIISHR